jgi:hypothetical protein
MIETTAAIAEQSFNDLRRRLECEEGLSLTKSNREG